MVQSKLARPMMGLRTFATSAKAARAAVLPLTESPFARPEVVDIATYKYPGEPNYPGMGPKAIPEQWEADERTVHYMIPKTFVDNIIAPKMGSTGLYTLGFGSVMYLLSREVIPMHAETASFVSFMIAVTYYNILVGDTIKETFEKEYTAEYDKFYACKEHDIAAYTEIVSKYKDAQEQAQGQAVFNEQKLTNLALMLETEYLNRQNMVVDSVTKKLNYQVAVQNALEDQESQHMINWIEDKVNQDISNLDQDEMINVCVANLKKMA